MGVLEADAKGVSCYSSADLVHWKFEGIVLPSVPQDSLPDLHPSQIMERPKVLYNEKTGKFVLWLHIDSPDYEKGMAGVAVADKPTGPFVYRGSFKPNGFDCRDQTLFKDTDGRAYHICATDWNETLLVSLLTDDYTGTTGCISVFLFTKSVRRRLFLKERGSIIFCHRDARDGIPTRRHTLWPTLC